MKTVEFYDVTSHSLVARYQRMEGWGPSIFRLFHSVHRHDISLQNVSLYPPNDSVSHVNFKDNKLLSHYLIHLTFIGQTGQCRPIKSTSVSSEWEYTVLTWSFELNRVPVTAENWNLEGHMLRVNSYLTLFMPQTQQISYKLKACQVTGFDVG